MCNSKAVGNIKKHVVIVLFLFSMPCISEKKHPYWLFAVKSFGESLASFFQRLGRNTLYIREHWHTQVHCSRATVISSLVIKCYQLIFPTLLSVLNFFSLPLLCDDVLYGLPPPGVIRHWPFSGKQLLIYRWRACAPRGWFASRRHPLRRQFASRRRRPLHPYADTRPSLSTWCSEQTDVDRTVSFDIVFNNERIHFLIAW